LNPYFIIPFVIWVIVGGIALLVFSKEELFTFFNIHHSSWGDVLMANITSLGEGIVGPLVILIIAGRERYRNWWFFICALLTIALPALITQIVKSSVNAPRPLKYFNEAVWIHISNDWPRLMERSFPSGHTCAAFCFFGFWAMLLYPKYRWLGLVFFLLALAVGYSRMYLAAHFFLDVYVGSLLGGIFTIVVMAIMSKHSVKFFTGRTIAEG
jgi:membrane-associated phospholipid phosphatase